MPRSKQQNQTTFLGYLSPTDSAFFNFFNGPFGPGFFFPFDVPLGALVFPALLAHDGQT